MKNAWQLTRSRAAEVPRAFLVWNKFVHPRLLCFIWSLFHIRTPTQVWVQSLGISVSRCALCKSNIETNLHLFLYCPYAVHIWGWLLKIFNCPWPSSNSAGHYWQALSSGKDRTGREIAASIFFHLISSLWFARNEAVFNNNLLRFHRFKHRF